MDAGGETASGSVLGQGSNEPKGTEARGRSLRTVLGAEGIGGAGADVHGRTGRDLLVVGQAMWSGHQAPYRNLDSVL